MIRVQILKNNIIVNQADFASSQDGMPNTSNVNEWINIIKKNNTFGKPQREIVAQKDINGNWYVENEDISLASSFREETDLAGNTIRFYSFAADYTIIQTDVTAEYNAIKAKEAAKNLAFEELKTIKPVMTLPELSVAVNKILLVLGIK